MGVVVKAIDHFLDIFVYEGVMRDIPNPFIQLHFGWQVAIEATDRQLRDMCFFQPAGRSDNPDTPECLYRRR